MVWNWDKDDIRGREIEREKEREREKRRRERIFEKDIYNNTQYICTCSQYPNYWNLLRVIGSYNLPLSSLK